MADTKRPAPARAGRTPTTLNAEDGALLDAVRTLRWPARRLTRAGLAGDHVSRVRGGAAEFTEYRSYRPGDDPARLDWKLLARSNRAYIRLSQERMVLPTTLVLDASASLGYPAATLEKWHHARRITLGLAAAAHRSTDPVGVLVATAAGPIHLPPRARRGVVHEIGRVLAGVTPAGSPALTPLLNAGRVRDRIVIISDFLGAPGTEEIGVLLRVAGQLVASGAEVYAVHVLHADELELPRRTALVRDPEVAELRRPLTEQIRDRYHASFAAWRHELAHRWRRTGAIYTTAVTTEPVPHAIRRITGQHSDGSPGARPGGIPNRSAR